ncbi:ferritin-like domain-containing protein [Nocardiopsis ansamitocini]|uniref:DUF4439 domain-containing protein n=1 Tax=Nocardiopsis ansamitocini TaxID=1670832 RepID=A0A9W6P3L0_9ACTN|nr:ferritin-like domain-containing protein [Nocardiopsis ansamitocini]GLU46447.1 hypothetical protein Nans01_07980 [Nocardiopsis ansamitocini]
MSTTPPSPDPTGSELPGVDSLQDALHAEHAAVYGYSYLGAQASERFEEAFRERFNAHRAQRDAVRTALVERAAEPVAGAAAYALPDDTDEDSLVNHADLLEQVAAQAYLELAGCTDPELRDLAGRSLRQTALSRAALALPLGPFPGFPGEEL